MTKILARSDYPKIRKLARTNYYTQTELGEMFGVTQSTIHLIIARKGKYAPRPKSPPGNKRKIILDGNKYFVYADGRIWSKYQGKFLAIQKQIGKDGYKCLRVRINSKYILLARLMLECFVGPPPSKRHQACHNDGNTLNCVITNLRWDIPQGNSDDKYAHRRQPHGEKHHSAKITDKQLEQFKKEWIRSGMTLSQFSRTKGPQIKLSTMTIYYAIKYRKDYNKLERIHRKRLKKL